jgi:integrase
MRTTQYSPENERIKRRYFTFLREAKRQSDATVDGAAEAIHRFEASNRYRDFKAFNIEQAIAFKASLARATNVRTGARLSKATICGTQMHLKRFFEWLAGEPGYRSRLKYSDAEYFNSSEKDARIAAARRERPSPTIEQVRHVIHLMPAQTLIEQRNRALVAFTLLTGARDSAIASMKVKHVDLVARSVFQDARQVKTKFSKSFTTYFFPVGEEVERIFVDWVVRLRSEALYGNEDPLFPSTRTGLDATGHFQALGLSKEHWRTASPIRDIFREAFTSGGLPYFNPHSFRNTLAALGESRCQSPEQFKAWSQNLGHERVLTTFTSYGAVSVRRQGELLTQLGESGSQSRHFDADQLAKAIAEQIRLHSVPSRALPTGISDEAKGGSIQAREFTRLLPK